MVARLAVASKPRGAALTRERHRSRLDPGLAPRAEILAAKVRKALAGHPRVAVPAITAMTGNFCLNNLFTYRDKRLRGGTLVTGLSSFYAVCGIGAAANVGIASHLFDANRSWWLAGLGGAAIGAVWNYAMSSVFIWRSGAATPARRVQGSTASVSAKPAALTYALD